MNFENFSDWVASLDDHPIFTALYGGVCFIIGALIF